MKKSKGKYDILLTIFLIIILIALLVTLGPYLFNEVKSEIAVRQALNDFDEKTSHSDNTIDGENTDNYDEADEVKGTLEDVLNELNSEVETSETNPSSKNDISAEIINYDAVGKIEIPKTNINYPIYGQIAKATLEAGVAIAYGPGLNQIGNTVIYGHNFRNGKFFSNNKKIKSGDNIYITDNNGNKVTYKVYSVYKTTPTDASYMIRETDGKREISLQTCTDDNSARIIIWATAD